MGVWMIMHAARIRSLLFWDRRLVKLNTLTRKPHMLQFVATPVTRHAFTRETQLRCQLGMFVSPIILKAPTTTMRRLLYTQHIPVLPGRTTVMDDCLLCLKRDL